MQWIQDPSQSKVHNLNNVRRDDSRHFGNKKKEYSKAKIEELETNSKIKNIRGLWKGINDFKNGYQTRPKIVNDEKGYLVAGSHSIFARWRNYFSQLLNVHGIKAVRQTEIYTAEPLVPEPNASNDELGIKKLKSHKSPGIVPIPAELIKTEGRKICPEIHKLIISIWNKEELPEEWKKSIIVSTNKTSDKTDCSNYRGISFLPTVYKMLSNILLSRLTPYAEKIIGITNLDFDATGQLLFIYSAFVKYWRKNGNTMKQ